MDEHTDSDPAETFICTSCGHDVPLDEVVVPEGVAYVIGFCGLDCYALWRAKAALIIQIEGG